MYRYKCVTGKGNNNSLEPNIALQTSIMPGDLQAYFEDGDKEQTIPKVVVKFVVATVTPPPKRRTEDSRERERQRTSNCSLRIPAELRSWNRRESHFLHS